MNSGKKTTQALAVITAGLLGIVCTSSEAGRPVRSDSSDGAFDVLGGFWGSDIESSGPGFAAGKTEFKLKINPNGSARFFTVCMGEGFIKLVTVGQACVAADFARPPSGNYIAVFAADLDDGSGSYIRTRGFVDTSAPFRLWQAQPAMRFWWNGVTLAGDTNPFDVQIVLIDRGSGNFDIEMNYGIGGDQVPPVPSADGFQGLKLGPNASGPTFGPFGPFEQDDTPIRYCFRGGSLRSTC